MKKFCRFLESHKNMAATFAQLAALFIILPTLFYLLGLLLPESAINSWYKILRSIPGFDHYYGYIIELAHLEPGSIRLIQHFIHLFKILETDVLKDALFSTAIIGMCLYAAKLLGNKLLMRGIPIVQDLIGIFLGIMLIYFTKLFAFNPVGIAVLIILIILNIVLTFTLVSEQRVKKFLALFIGIGLSIFTAAESLAYVSVMTLIADGVMPTFMTAVILTCTTAIPFLIFVTVDYYLLMPKR